MEPFFARNKKGEKVWTGGWICCVCTSVVSGAAPVEKDTPKRASSVFRSITCQKCPVLEGNPIDASVYRLPSLFPLPAYKERGWDSGEEEDDDKRVMSLYKKDGVNGVFSFAFSSSALLRAYHVWWHFDWCSFSSFLLLGLCNQYFCVFYFVPYLTMVILVFPLF